MFGQDWLYQLTPRDRAADVLGIACLTHTPFGRSVAAAGLTDVFEISSDVPVLWTLNQVHVQASGGGAQTVTAISFRVEGRTAGNDLTILNEATAAAQIIRTVNLNPLVFDSRTHNRLLVIANYSAGAVANFIASQVHAILQPLGNVAPASFVTSVAP